MPVRKTRHRDAGPRVGERFRGAVRDLTSAGLGVVAHDSGRVFFVPGVWVGEAGEFEITALRGRSGEAKLVLLDELSPQRVHAPCEHHGLDERACGGCPWMFMDYDAQLAAKQQRVARAFSPFESAKIEALWPSPQTLGYRNRAQLKTDGRRLGFVAARSRRLAEVRDCLVLNDHNRATLRALRDELPRKDWQPRRGRGWSTLDIDDDVDAAGVSLNARRPFRQGNSAQNERMRQWLRDTLTAIPAATDGTALSVVELFAGSGNFTELLPQCGCDPVHAVDSFPPAVQALADRSLPGVTAQCADLNREDAAEQLAGPLAEAQLLLLDPPREGLRTIAAFLERAEGLGHILYVSCDVATCARDLEVAAACGFRLRTVQPLDLFPHTPHVELLCHLERGTP